jgi:pimeloyl-ACP methyl ester carboxylesterase
MVSLRGIRVALALFLVAVAAFACGDSDSSSGTGASGGAGGAEAKARTYVLVHGAFAGAWTWERVVPLLEADGSTVLTLDLPGHGDDSTPVADATLDAYTAKVVALIDSASEPVVLVGHSMGGLVVSQAAEARPEKIEKLVYLAAFLAEDGASLLTASAGDTESTLQTYVTIGTDSVTLAPEGVLGAFCTDCNDADAQAIVDHLEPEPLAPFTTPIHTTAEKWGSVPRFYIETLQDKAIGPARQKQFYTALPCEKVVSLSTGHAPFLTQPDALADAILSL